MSSGSSLASRLVSACYTGDLPSAAAAVADGASVNEEGEAPGWAGTLLPLSAAAYNGHHDVVVWLLSHGADANGHEVMYFAAYSSTAGVLQLLIDVGGDVNRQSWNVPPVFAAVDGGGEDKVRVLLAQPSLDVTATYKGKAPQHHARDEGRRDLADMIAQEVSVGSGDFGGNSLLADLWTCLAVGWQIARRATLVRPLFHSLRRECAVQRA